MKCEVHGTTLPRRAACMPLLFYELMGEYLPPLLPGIDRFMEMGNPTRGFHSSLVDMV